jgi:HAD superfamily hydrolase (TIGR01484 family)
MRYLALASDYDGTLAHDGCVDAATVAALQRLRASGRKLILVTGRELDDLLRVFPQSDIFDRVVAENGAVLYRPATHETHMLAEHPPLAFIDALRARGVAPLAVGQVIVATWEPHETEVIAAIRDLGLELQVIFNKGAVMVLPPGVNKGSGLHAALRELDLSAHNVVGVGDAENDHAFLSLCECGVAVANALPGLKERADITTQADHGAGVVEISDQLIASDLAELAPRLVRHQIVLGTREHDEPVALPAQKGAALVAGPSGSGKSSLVLGMLERCATQGYQFALIDPEGDYEPVAGATVLGDSQRAPGISEIMQLLDAPDASVIVNLLGLQLADRPEFFSNLLARLVDLRTRTGRPHWLIVDEAHHLMPAAWAPAHDTLPQHLDATLLLTLEPDHIARPALELVQTVIAVGAAPARTIGAFCGALGIAPPAVPAADLPTGASIVWLRDQAAPFRMQATPSQADHRRHVRKYAQGELGEDKSFFFRGPEGALHLRAHNLAIFMQMADGVDDATWLFHLQRGDYERWFRAAIKDDELADAAARVVHEHPADVAMSRAGIRAAIEQRYTLPA